MARLLFRLDSDLVYTESVRSAEQQIREIYRILYGEWGAQHWWPAESPFEVVVGAYLTQNTAWTNVEHAIAHLRAQSLLDLEAFRTAPLATIEQAIRPAGYFRQKASRLKLFVGFLDRRYAGSLDLMFAQPTARLRAELLELTGVGPETADSILLYAGDHPVFVVDAYTRRLLERHGLASPSATYEQIRQLFEQSLSDVKTAQTARASLQGAGHQPSAMSTRPRPPAVQTFNELHAVIVGVGKRYCSKRNPDCSSCPLQTLLPSP